MLETTMECKLHSMIRLHVGGPSGPSLPAAGTAVVGGLGAGEGGREARPDHASLTRHDLRSEDLTGWEAGGLGGSRG